MYDHNAVVRHLSDGNWHTSKNIAVSTGVSAVRMRELCQDHPGSFISGQQGYKRADLATQEEISACVNNLLGRAGAILLRAKSLNRRRQYLAKAPERPHLRAVS